jgi:transcriptional regulator with XRE-family HTH domain
MARTRTAAARSPEYESLGRNIAEARNALNLSQAEAAKKIGISQSTYSGYETGTRRINLSMLKRIAAALEVSEDQLIGHTDTKLPPLVLSDAEYSLIIHFRQLSDAEQSVVLRSVGINEEMNERK